MRSLHSAVICIMLAGAAGSARADSIQSFTPVERASITVRTVPGRAVDVLGISTGTTAAAVETALGASLGADGVRRETRTLGAYVKGVQVRTNPYTAGVFFQTDPSAKYREDVTSTFGSPASGNKLLSLSRSVIYADALSAPTIDQLKADLIQKYGRPSYEGAQGVWPSLKFAYKDGRQVFFDSKLLNPPRGFSNSAYQPEMAADYAREAAQVDFIVDVLLTESGGGRVASLRIDISDFAARAAAAKADVDTIMERAVQSLASTAGVRGPRL